MRYIIGVDGGGTKTVAIAYSLDGEIVSHGESGYGNVMIQAEQAILHVKEAIQQCLIPLDNQKLEAISLGLAGMASGQYRDQLEKELAFYGVPILLTTDARIAHAAVLQGEDGILVIAGTGSVAIVLERERIQLAGGWGHLLGDEGSGYWIAIKAFQHMIREEEESLLRSGLNERILGEIECKEVSQVKRFVYQATKDQIARLAAVVAEGAERGCEQAMAILQEAGQLLAHMAVRLYRKTSLPEDVSIGLMGGVLTNNMLVRSSFTESIASYMPRANVVVSCESPTKGTLYLAKKQLGL
ncbi:N-acetylglucosamine kinase [Brevibacillus daliensis]|uniref:N-acetylglucosamine kinase n=1 Tax=Brevibacillus daliensis TaxID=2892995 RepID=UPI001E4228AC|nr:BadF/BadG/BcrA/BcrD ATPase family protein [Brevibacillus daliensis]